MPFHPDPDYLSLARPVLEDMVDFYEVVPESLWRVEDDGSLGWNEWAGVLEQVVRRSGRPIVAHGLGYSPGTAPGDAADDARAERWLEHLRRDHERFDYLWYTEHLGWNSFAGRELTLPLPLPPTEEAVRTVATRLGRIAEFVDVVGFENQVGYFNRAGADAEPSFWNRICEAGDLWLLLDLHNAYSQCVNFDLELDAFLDALDLSRVIEVHLSGGSDSEAAWLDSGAVMRLDSHDGPVPEPVWEAFERIRPRCPNLRAVIVEWFDEAIEEQGEASVAILADEVRRARSIFSRNA